MNSSKDRTIPGLIVGFLFVFGLWLSFVWLHNFVPRSQTICRVAEDNQGYRVELASGKTLRIIGPTDEENLTGRKTSSGLRAEITQVPGTYRIQLNDTHAPLFPSDDIWDAEQIPDDPAEIAKCKPRGR